MAQKSTNFAVPAAVVQTTDETTATTIASYDLASAAASNTGVAFDNCAVSVRAQLTGYTAAGNTATVQMAAAFKRVAGTLSQVGVTVNLMALQADAALATAVPTIDASGTTIRVRVTGVAGQTINWLASLEVFINQP